MTRSARVTLLLMMLTASAPLALAPKIYATRGVVTTADAAALVLSRPQHRGTITITLTSTTHVEGVIRTGAMVSVRYREEGARHIAIAVTVENDASPMPQAPERPLKPDA